MPWTSVNKNCKMQRKINSFHTVWYSTHTGLLSNTSKFSWKKKKWKKDDIIENLPMHTGHLGSRRHVKQVGEWMQQKEQKSQVRDNSWQQRGLSELSWGKMGLKLTKAPANFVQYWTSSFTQVVTWKLVEEVPRAAKHCLAEETLPDGAEHRAGLWRERWWRFCPGWACALCIGKDHDQLYITAWSLTSLNYVCRAKGFKEKKVDLHIFLEFFKCLHLA